VMVRSRHLWFLTTRHLWLKLDHRSKNRPICRLISRLIVNRWVSDKIIAYRSDLSPRLIFWPKYTEFYHLPRFGSRFTIRETVFLANSLVEVYISSNFTIFVDSNARNQGNTFVQYSNVFFA
jgi:hypothetical protein